MTVKAINRMIQWVVLLTTSCLIRYPMGVTSSDLWVGYQVGATTRTDAVLPLLQGSFRFPCYLEVAPH